jgi:tetratricopeptide (TPR) repeat protein
MASSWGVLGDIERNRGNWDAAERLYRQSLQLREELGDRSGMSTSIGCLGEIAMLRGDLDAAEIQMKDSLSQLYELGDPSKIAESNWDLAKLHRAKNNPDRAQQHYHIAHQLYSQLGAAKDLEKIEREWKEQ